MSEQENTLRHERIEVAYGAFNAAKEKFEQSNDPQDGATAEALWSEVERLEAIPHTLDELTAEYALMPRECRGPRSEEGDQLVTAAFEAGDVAEAKRLDSDPQYRPGCGVTAQRVNPEKYGVEGGFRKPPKAQDINALILAGPLDGKDHEMQCPQCGLTIAYRPPVVEG